MLIVVIVLGCLTAYTESCQGTGTFTGSLGTSAKFEYEISPPVNWTYSASNSEITSQPTTRAEALKIAEEAIDSAINKTLAQLNIIPSLVRFDYSIEPKNIAVSTSCKSKDNYVAVRETVLYKCLAKVIPDNCLTTPSNGVDTTTAKEVTTPETTDKTTAKPAPEVTDKTSAKAESSTVTEGPAISDGSTKVRTTVTMETTLKTTHATEPRTTGSTGSTMTQPTTAAATSTTPSKTGDDDDNGGNGRKKRAVCPDPNEPNFDTESYSISGSASATSLISLFQGQWDAIAELIQAKLEAEGARVWSLTASV